MATVALAEGTLFANRYRVLRCIGAGSMGAVYEVLHVETDRRRALKVMLPHLVGSGDLHERFRAEAKIAAHVDSEYIVDVFDAGVDEATGTPFLVMELLHGEELAQLLARVVRLGPEEVVMYLHQVALALDKTHRAGIIHRDLKPENLFLCHREGAPPQIKVLDFGVAKLVSAASRAAPTRVVGTPLYMAPEQFETKRPLSAATDVYALGMIAHTLLCGAPYWSLETHEGVDLLTFANRVMLGPPEPASHRARRAGVLLPRAFDAWFARATAPSPADRFQSASAAVAALADTFALQLPSAASIAPTVRPATLAKYASAAPSRLPAPPTLPVLSVAPVASSAAPIAARHRHGAVLAITTLTGALCVGAGVLFWWHYTLQPVAASASVRTPATVTSPPRASAADPIDAGARPPAQATAPARPPAATPWSGLPQPRGPFIWPKERPRDHHAPRGRRMPDR